MVFKSISYADKSFIHKLNILSESCDNYEPFYTDSFNSDFIQLAAFDNFNNLVGFMGLLRCFGQYETDISEYFELSAMVSPAFRNQGVFSGLLSSLNTLSPEQRQELHKIPLICPIPQEYRSLKCAGDLAFTEYLMKLEQSEYSASVIGMSLDDTSTDNLMDEILEFEFCDDDMTFYMYDDSSDEDIGHIRIDYQDTFVNLFDVYVEKNKRRRGLGTAMLKIFLSEYFNGSYGQILPLVLNVTSTNPSALGLYKKFGFNAAAEVNYFYIKIS